MARNEVAKRRNAKTKGAAVPLDPGEIIERIDELLEVRYRSADLGNLSDPLDETIYILLSRQTREEGYQQTFRKLRARYTKWVEILSANPEEIEELLRPVGFQRARSRELLGILEMVRADNQARRCGPYASPPVDLTLGHLSGFSDRDAEAFLDGLPGIGPKSARCIMAYSLGRDRFAVDTHVYRIFQRLGIVATRTRKADHDPLELAVPQRLRTRLHVNLVHHGRAICTGPRPKCDQCVLISFCKTGRKSTSSSNAPVAVELFAGAGGFGFGAKAAGFRIALAVELDRHAAQTYRSNHPGVPVIEADVARLKAGEIHKLIPKLHRLDALFAGPPCQGYSIAGARLVADPKNTLFRHVSRLARELKARYVVIENVPGLRNVRGVSFVRGIKISLARSGYATRECLLNAADFGVAQLRKRLVFVSRHRQIRNEAPAGPPLPDPLPTEGRLLRALEDLPLLPPGESAEYRRLDDGRVLLNGSTMAHKESVITKINGIKRNGRSPISYRRLGTDLAPTIIAGHRAFPVHPVLDRTISVREAARIQGFPDTYVFCGPRSTQPLQVANAVPPAVAIAVAAHVKALIELDRISESSVARRRKSTSLAAPPVKCTNDVSRPHQEALEPFPATSMLEDEVALIAQ
jgi:DNA (cytosine-5)-methyltransferase 1